MDLQLVLAILMMVGVLAIGAYVAIKLIPFAHAELADPVERDLHRRGFNILLEQKQIEGIPAKSERVPCMLQNLDQRDRLLEEYKDWQLKKQIAELVEKSA